VDTYIESGGVQEWEPVRLTIPLLGYHQVENAATAYAALKASGLEISDEDIRIGFARVNWPCRFEIARHSVPDAGLLRELPVIFDSAHNQDSFVRLRQTLDEYFPGRPVILILGASEDKNLPGMLEEIKPRLRLLIATKADHPRALDPEIIVEAADRIGVRAEAAAPVSAALARALELAEASRDLVLSAGSMFVTAEVKTA
jgi:dihydrofolate synthase/folylpolyglutamate synthase